MLPLSDASVTDIPDEEDLKFGFQINHADKSFHVYAPSLNDKNNWMTNLKKYITYVCNTVNDHPMLVQLFF